MVRVLAFQSDEPAVHSTGSARVKIRVRGMAVQSEEVILVIMLA